MEYVPPEPVLARLINKFIQEHPKYIPAREDIITCIEYAAELYPRVVYPFVDIIAELKRELYSYKQDNESLYHRNTRLLVQVDRMRKRIDDYKRKVPKKKPSL